MLIGDYSTMKAVLISVINHESLQAQ